MRAALDVAYPMTFYDETTDETSATTITLANGNREEANVTLHAVPALHLTVDSGTDRTGAWDTQTAPDDLRHAGGPGECRVHGCHAHGDHRVHGFAPGHYELVQGDPPRIAELDATTSQQVDPLLGSPTVTVSGVLRNGAGLLPCGSNAFTSLSLESVENTRQNPQGANCKNGEFSFQGVPSGAWRLSVQSQSGQLQVATIAVGNRVHGGNEFTVGDRPVTLTVTVSDSATRITGFARKNGKGEAG
jgi:hypothetical protein